MTDLLYEEECYAVRGVIYEVYRQMGCGFLEGVYQECMEIELDEKNIPFVAQKELKIYYKDKLLEHTYKPDLICYDKMIVELKSVKDVLAEHKAQLYNYLKVSGFRLGFLVNFGHYPGVGIERVIL